MYIKSNTRQKSVLEKSENTIQFQGIITNFYTKAWNFLLEMGKG